MNFIPCPDCRTITIANWRKDEWMCPYGHTTSREFASFYSLNLRRYHPGMKPRWTIYPISVSELPGEAQVMLDLLEDTSEHTLIEFNSSYILIPSAKRGALHYRWDDEEWKVWR